MVRARNPRAALLAVIVEGFFGRLAFGMLSFALPLYARSVGLSLAELGMLVSLRSILVLPLKPAAGWLADRIGIRPVYLLGSLARTLAAAWLLVSGDFLSLAGVRALQGASAAGRDVASLGVVARDAGARVASAYSWYATAKHIGGVTGAALAGVIITASGGSFRTLFLVVIAMSILPLLAAWIGLRETSEAPETDEEQVAADRADPTQEEAQSWAAGSLALARELAGPALVGMLVAASAYMVHGIFPVLATEYAGLSEAQAGLVYTLSAVVFLLTGPAFGWLSDRYGRVFGLAWRSAANIGSSILYMLSPSFASIALARSVDDSGKAAFRPAWASAIAEVSGADPRQRGRRIGLLDTAATAGEVVGPALAGLLWQSGGIVALFGARIVIAVVAELAAIKVFGELSQHLRPSPTLTRAAYFGPAAVALVAALANLAVAAQWGAQPVSSTALLVSSVIMLLGVLVSEVAGPTAAAAERRALVQRQEEELSRLRHDVRRSLTVIRGEVELILSQADVPTEERRSSSESVFQEIERVVKLLSAYSAERSR